MTDVVRVPRWERPGPGTWELDSSHSSGAPGPVLREIIETCLERGVAEGMALFGAPLRGMEMRWVNGKFYRRLVPLIGGGRDLPPPPAPVLWLVTRIHPAFRRQERRAAETFESKRWRDEIRRWEHEWKPDIVKQNLALGDVEPGSLDDALLGQHLVALHDHLRRTATLHFRLHVTDMGPLGDLMVHLEDWGLERDDTFRALVAASPSTRAPVEQLHLVADAVRRAGVDPAELSSLDEVRAASPEAASRLDEHLRFHGWRLTTGYDLEDRTLIELPELVLGGIRAATNRTSRPADEDGLTSLAALRDQVPAAHRATFDELVEDARLSYGLRDENGPITFEWPAGLLRRALLEAGRRLHARGSLAEADDVFELVVDEVRNLLGGSVAPGLEEIGRRAEERRWWTSLDPPPRLGPEEPPPPVSVMPPHLGRITRLVLAVVGSLEAAREREPLRGTGIGSAPYVGTARVVHDAGEALAAVEPGDVIVAAYTAPTYNAVLGIAGAVVTEDGGLLCHAAVLARELGLPAVIGASDAMTRIPDGSTVEADPRTGRVRVLS